MDDTGRHDADTTVSENSSFVFDWKEDVALHCKDILREGKWADYERLCNSDSSDELLNAVAENERRDL